MQTASDAKQQILMLKQLPPLSATATRLLEILTSDNLSLHGLAKVIAQDPTVTARILGVANSAYFGQTVPIHSVEDAIIRVLGLNMVKSLAFSIALSGVFNTARCQGFDLEDYWYRSLATALLSREICQHVASAQRPDLDSVYLAGLLFDIGSLVLVHLFPEDYAKAIATFQQSPTADRQTVEMETVGISSQQAGAWLTDRWHLPALVVQVVAQSPLDDAQCEVAAVSLASQLVALHQQADTAMPEVSAHLPGLSTETLAMILAKTRLRDDELHSIASVMVK
ncbi:MAG: HDOD domain-containing protein [Candidatus Thiodiazotropha sp.]